MRTKPGRRVLETAEVHAKLFMLIAAVFLLGLALPPLSLASDSAPRQPLDFRMVQVGADEALMGEKTGQILADTIDGIPSNSVIDLEVGIGFLWLATGAGVGRFTPIPAPPDPEDPVDLADGDWFVSTHETEGIGRGGISAVTSTVTAWGDSVIWSATAFDSTTSRGDLATGGGVGFSIDFGETWTWMPQPQDSLTDSTDFAPTVTPVQNVTYDIGILNDRVWIASFGGGVRYFDMFDGMEEEDPMELVWVNRPPDTLAFDVAEQFNHRAFSVAVDTMNQNVWVGTAAGVNLTRDQGQTWQNFRHSGQNENTPNGNFVTSLGVQQLNDGRTIVWMGGWVTSSETGQFYGVSKTENNGITWQRVLGSQDDPIRVHNFAFQDSIVYVASDQGLFKSADLGETWGVFPNPIDITSNERFYTDEVFTAAWGFDRLWVGGPEGLGISTTGGNDWAIERTAPDPGGGTFAYPNPFSPERFPVVRMRYEMARADLVTVEVYDFAMELLIRPVDSQWRSAGEHDEVWDGRDPQGGEIANGVYFYRISGGGDERWGKILVLD